jgi:2-methylisocitrate lyase-like PEP mutase family enzyme
MTRFDEFSALHTPGNPLVLFNIWDAGSAQAVARSGARALATSSASVAEANGLTDGQEVAMDFAIANAKRIIDAVDLPVTIDFEGAYASNAEGVEQNARLLAATGAIGCNFEDQLVGSDALYPIEEQASRIAAVRRAVGPDFFINARTDVFMKAPMETHDAAMVERALERARAYAEAGANGFFVPLLADLRLLERMCAKSPLPVNFMTFPGCPSNRDVAAAGIARISYGPFPYRDLVKGLEEAARLEIGHGRLNSGS